MKLEFLQWLVHGLVGDDQQFEVRALPTNHQHKLTYLVMCEASLLDVKGGLSPIQQEAIAVVLNESIRANGDTITLKFEAF